MNRFISKITLICFLLIIFFSLNTFAYEGKEVSISGRIVRTSAAGVSLSDVNINVTGTKTFEVTADRYGNYIIPNLPAGGTYTVEVSKLGYTFSPKNRIYRNLTESQVDENFTASVSTYSISGRVIVGGKGVRGALVMVNNRSIKYFTDNDGYYKIDNLEYDGPYIVTVTSDEHTFDPLKVQLLNRDIVYNFTKDISIKGRVTSAGEGIKNIMIDVNGSQYKTDKNGYYEVNGLTANGDYYISVANEKLNVEPKFIELKKITKNEDNIDFAVVSPISGKVTFNGKPLAGVFVKINGKEDKTYKTNAAGYYKTDGMELGRDYVVVPSNFGYSFEPKERSVVNLSESVSNYNFVATVSKYIISGTVMMGNQPIKGATIYVTGAKSTYKTDENGRYSIKGFTHGKDWTIAVDYPGVDFIESQKIITNIEADTEVNFAGALSISGSVMAGSRSIKGAIVTYGNNLNVRTNDRGIYTIKNLKADASYKISVSSTNYTFVPSSINIDNLSSSIKNQNFDVVLSISGRVLNGKTGIKNAQIRVLDNNEAKVYNTDKDGYYEIPGLYYGKDYTLTVITEEKGIVLSPKFKLYKRINQNMKNQNFQVVANTNFKQIKQNVKSPVAIQPPPVEEPLTEEEKERQKEIAKEKAKIEKARKKQEEKEKKKQAAKK